MQQGAGKGLAIGYVLAVVQGVFYSTLGIWTKLIYATGLGPADVILLRFVIAVVVMGAFLLLSRRERLFSRSKLTYLQGVCFFFSEWLYCVAVEHLTAGMTTVIFYIYPAIIAVLAIFLFKERFTLLLFVVIVMTLAGMFFISGMLVPGSIRLDPFGIAMAFLSCLAFAVYSVIVQKVGDAEGAFTTTFTVSFVALLISLVVFGSHLPSLAHLSAYQMSLGAGTALFNAVLPVIIFVAATKRIGATKASLVGAIEAPCSLFLSWLVLGEVLTPWQFVGSALIVLAVVLVSAQPLMEQRRRRRRTASGGD